MPGRYGRGIAATLLATNLLTTPAGPIQPNEGPALAVNQQRSSEKESVNSKEPAKGAPSSESEQSKARDFRSDYLANTPESGCGSLACRRSNPTSQSPKPIPVSFTSSEAKLDPSTWRDREWLNEWIEPWAFKPSALAYLATAFHNLRNPPARPMTCRAKSRQKRASRKVLSRLHHRSPPNRKRPKLVLASFN